MTVRTWLYSQLIDPEKPLFDLIQDRVYAKKSMQSSVSEHPYVVFKLGNATNEEISETLDVYRQFVQIFVHDFTDDTVGDYGRIDEVIKAIKKLLINNQSPADGVVTVKFLETSQDLNDETLSTVMKYIRFQIIVKETL